jgi:GT2 family glycosyltransferase
MNHSARAVDEENRPTVSVIIPVHNGGAAFRACLASLHKLTPPPAEIIIVNDGGTDGSAAYAAQQDLCVLTMPGRHGPAAARNRGARAATGEILLFLDADVHVHPTVVGQVVEFFRDHPEVSALIGSYDDTPAAPNLLSQYKNLLQHFVHQHARAEGYTFWGACGAIRRNVFLAHGGYDETYRQPCIEDIELGYRLRAAGWRVRVLQQLQVKHLKRWTILSLFRSDFFRRALPWTALILRTGKFDDDLNISRTNRLKVLLTGVLLLVLGLAWWWPVLLVGAALAAAALLTLDWKLLTFFRKKRGLLFALRTIPWHWFSYFYSGLAFALGLVVYALGRKQPPPAAGSGTASHGA